MSEKRKGSANKLISLIMPVYHEGDGVIPVIATLFLTVHYPFKLFVVYDSENDTTIDTIKKLQKEFDDIYLIQNEWKKGVLNAIRTGFKNADTPYVGIWVAYHVDPFGILNRMIEILEDDNDLVSANRFAAGTKRARGNTLKRMLSFWGNSILNQIIGMPINDVTTSLKIYRKSLLEAIPIETTVNGGWALSAELAIKAAIKGFRLAEVPLEGKNINLIHGITNFKVLKQLPVYFRWLYLGWKNRILIKEHTGKRIKIYNN